MGPNSNVTSIIDSNNEKLSACVSTGDWAAAARCYTNYARLMASNVDTITNDGLAAFWQGAIDMGVKDATLISDTVEVHGDTAIEVGKYVL